MWKEEGRMQNPPGHEILHSAFCIPGQEPAFFPNPRRAEMEMPRGLALDMPLYPLG
jgi:hypothetical protein